MSLFTSHSFRWLFNPPVHKETRSKTRHGFASEQRLILKKWNRYFELLFCQKVTRLRSGDASAATYLCTELGLGYSDDEFHHRGDLRLQRRNHVDQSCELLGGAFTCNTHRHT